MTDDGTIATFPIVQAGLALSAEELNAIIVEHRSTLLTLVPSLMRLRCSMLSHKIQPTGEGLVVKFALVESSQTSLSVRVRISAQDEIPPSHSLELADIKREIMNLPPDLIYAASPARVPQSKTEVSRMRRLLKKLRAGSLELPQELNVPTSVIDSVARYLPTGTPVFANLYVRRLSPTEAEVEVKGLSRKHSGDPLETRDTRIILKRTRQHETIASGQILQHAMDSKVPIQIDAIALYSWIDHTLQSLELVGFI